MVRTSSRAAVRGTSRGHAALLRAADALALVASPAFAIMAALTCFATDDASRLFCSTSHASAIGGMATMYLLMSALHAGPWMKLIVLRQRGLDTHMR